VTTYNLIFGISIEEKNPGASLLYEMMSSEMVKINTNISLWCRGHRACLSSWETRGSILDRTSTQGFKIIEEKELPFILTSVNA
jgi:hypothetical protein